MEVSQVCSEREPPPRSIAKSVPINQGHKKKSELKGWIQFGRSQVRSGIPKSLRLFLAGQDP